MIWLGIDFEATGVNPAKDLPTEVAVVFYDPMDHRVIHAVSMVLALPQGVVMSPEVQALTGITTAIASKRVYTFAHFLATLSAMVLECPPTHWIGHNISEYDLPMFRASWERALADPALEIDQTMKDALTPLLQMPYIDTMVDVPYGPEIQSKKLKYLAADHGFMNLMAHSALSDVLTTIRIASNYSPNDLVRNADSPMVVVRAMVEYAEKDKAKAAGFYYDGARKYWLFKIRKSRIAEMKWPFDICILGEEAADTKQTGDPF